MNGTQKKKSQTKLEERCQILEEKCREYVTALETSNLHLENEIEKHKKTEAKLKISEARFRKIFEYAPIGAAIVDLDGKIVFSNKALCSMLAYDKSELANMHFAGVTHEEDIDKDLELFEKLIKGERAHYTIEKRYTTKGGKIIWGRLAVTLTGDDNSKENLAIAMVEDITTQIQVRDKIIKSRDDLERIVAERTREIQSLKDRLQAENLFLRKELSESHQYGEIIGESHAIRTVISQIELVAPTDANVLIQGDSGTGKELVAREIHKHSNRSSRPLIKVNCATIPKDLYESEFFGHVKGAFTGAISNRIGRFEAADGGTLFLDEVGEIPISLQSKMLRVLQEGQFERVGEGKTRTVNVRIIAATNKDLRHEVKVKRFRDDLFYRLNVFPIQIAPLCERKDDIPLLALHFVDRISRKMNLHAPELTEANIMDLQNYDWPGNVRELENAIERAIILSRQGRMQFNLTLKTDLDGESLRSDVRKGPDKNSDSVLSLQEFRQLERQNAINALRQCNWKISGKDSASELLGLKPTTLVERMKRWQIKKPG